MKALLENCTSLKHWDIFDLNIIIRITSSDCNPPLSFVSNMTKNVDNNNEISVLEEDNDDHCDESKRVSFCFFDR